MASINSIVPDFVQSISSLFITRKSFDGRTTQTLIQPDEPAVKIQRGTKVWVKTRVNGWRMGEIQSIDVSPYYKEERRGILRAFVTSLPGEPGWSDYIRLDKLRLVTPANTEPEPLKRKSTCDGCGEFHAFCKCSDPDWFNEETRAMGYDPENCDCR